MICCSLQYNLKNLVTTSGRMVYLSLLPLPKTFNLCSLGKIFSIFKVATSFTLNPEQKARISQHLYFKQFSSLNIFKNTSLEIIVGTFLFNLVDGNKSLFNFLISYEQFY